MGREVYVTELRMATAALILNLLRSFRSRMYLAFKWLRQKEQPELCITQASQTQKLPEL
jgi:hypothetical protein